MTKLLSVTLFLTSLGWAQTQGRPIVEQPDAEHTREELSQLLRRYPPAIHDVFSLDPTLLVNQSYLAPYPALMSYLSAHPEIAHNPSFYVGRVSDQYRQDHTSRRFDLWNKLLEAVTIFGGFGLAIGLITWLIRTLLDYRRWNRLTKVQSDVHAKLLDRFTANEELLDYIKSPAGSKFLESSPITLDAGPRTIGAPFSRILWSVQVGVVLVAGGIGLWFVGERIADEISQPIHALGILAVALGLGFVVSAIFSFFISRRLGLIEQGVRG